jgi:transcriptional regulator with XRE-family HTH domain
MSIYYRNDQKLMTTEHTYKTDERHIHLSTFLRELRINSGYTQEQVAKEINLSRTSISKIERMSYFRIQHLYLLADFYEIPLHQLFAEI